MMQSFCEMVIQQKQAANIDQSPPQEMSIQEMEDLKQQYLDEMLSLREFKWNGESTIPLNEIVSQIPPSIAITPVLPTLEPEDSLIIGDENLSTILEKESDEFIKSSVEDLILMYLSDIEDGYHDSEGDIIYLESLLFDDIIPNLPPDVFLDHDPKNLKDGSDNEDLKRMNKVNAKQLLGHLSARIQQPHGRIILLDFTCTILSTGEELQTPHDILMDPTTS
ncbi:hypothetical protein Tco_1112266 [Tanacetum coccineum]|uniref:Reverse transcriptase domain-containing protein n=1 Tax=Tanacetum coccineum TaxID=301880 RepID=A0ABQ5IP34_9ASTR